MIPRILLILFLSISICSGNDLDSLSSLLKTTVDARQRVDLYNKLADILWHSNIEKAGLYSDSAYQLSLKTDNYKKGRVEALINMGINAYTLGDYKSAKKYYQDAMNLGNTTGYNTLEIFQYYLKIIKRQGQDSKLLTLVDSVLQTGLVTPEQKTRLLITKNASLIDLGYIIESRQVLAQFDNLDTESNIYLSVLMQKAAIESYSGNYRNALNYVNQALERYVAKGDSLNIAFAYMELGKLYLDKGRYDSALVVLNQSQQINKNTGYSFGVAQNLYLKGSLYYNMGQTDNSAQYYYQALEIFERQFNQKEMAETYYDLAWLFVKRDIKLSYQFINQSIQISKEIDNKTTESKAYNYLGSFYEDENKYDSAIMAYDKSLELRKELKDEKGIATCEFNKGSVYEKMGQYQLALDLYLKTYPIDVKYGDILNAGISEYMIGGLYVKMNNYKEAYKFLQKSKKNLSDIDAKSYLVDCLLNISKYYEAIKDDKNALLAYKEYIALKDEVYNGVKDVRFAELEVRYILEKKEQELALVGLENENRIQDIKLQEVTINNQQALIWVISIGILLVGILLLATYRLLLIRNKTNKELEELNRQISENTEEITAQSEELQEANEEIVSLNEGLEDKISKRTEELKEAHKELDTFFYHASHDFRRPLTTFLGLADIAHSILNDPTALELFDKVRETAGSLDRMVGKLRAISTISFDKLAVTEVDFEALCKKIMLRHNTIITEKNVKVICDFNLEGFITSSDITEIILDNIIENAILYSRKEVDSWIKIETSIKDSALVIVVSDNGQGIEDYLTSRIFEMYFRANEISQGNGLGLYIANKAVKKLNGTITFNTEYAKSTTFIITLPPTNQSVS